jgi:hypothetical protein
MRKITLRRNFTEETVVHEDGEETQIVFEEADVLVCERNNMADFVASNYGNLFELGLMQMEQKAILEQNESATKKLITEGNLVNELQMLGQQITNVMLEVM